MNNKLFFYQGNAVTFQLGNGDVMVNATEMAKAFGKLPADFLKTQRAQDYIKELAAMKNIIPADFVKVINGGNSFGTWMHEDVALEFARWLSPSFAIWCNERIKELMKLGFTATPQTVEQILSDPDTIIRLATALKEERAAKELAQETAKLQSVELQKAAPKVIFADSVTTSDNSILVADLAKILKQNGVEIGQNRLFEWLRKNEFLGRKGEYYNKPTQKAMELGLFDIKETTINKPNGTAIITFTTKVTGKGQVYFVNKFLSSEN
jgi:phage antirepressor YoqD-like protein